MNVSVIIEEYLNGSSLAALSRKYNISAYRIKSLLQKNNIAIRSRNEQNKYSPQNQRKYYINDNYFDKIDCEDKAYLLGFLAADGTIQPDGSVKIALSSIDKELLIKIQTVLKTNYPIRDSITKDGFTVSTFVFRSSKIREQLTKYNIIKNKTYTYSFPEALSEKYIPSFIKGYWDGDGTVCMSGGYPRTSLCSHQKGFLEDVINKLETLYNIPKVKVYQKKGSNIWYFQYSKESSRKLYELFYSNPSYLFLERKYSKFKELFGEIKSHEPATSQAEDKIV